MKQRFMFLVALMLAVSTSLWAADKMKKEKEVSLKGEVVDVACYIAQGARGDKHKDCAEACAKAGGSLGILTKEGKLYVSLLPDDHTAGPNAMLMDHIAETVVAKGFVRSKGGVNAIMIKSVEAAK